ncbi:Hypothetical protein ABZS17G119_03517 [Kosakonia cowanii]
MKFHGQASVRLFDLRLFGRFRHAENLVIILLRHRFICPLTYEHGRGENSDARAGYLPCIRAITFCL